MAKNLMSQIIKMLGLEYEEEFKIRCLDAETCQSGVYKFTENEGLMEKNKQGKFYTNCTNFEDICLGNYDIVKLPWEPKDGEKYWTIRFVGIDKPSTDSYIWTSHSSDFAYLRLGIVYRTCEEAEAHLEEDYERLTGKPLSSR